MQLISSSSWFIGLVVTVPRWILFSQEGMCMCLVCPEHMVLLPPPGAAGWCSCSAQTEHPCMQGTHGWQCWDARGWMLRDAHGAGMLRLDVGGCLWLAVQGCLWYRDACGTGMLRPAVQGGSWHRATCSQRCGDAISQDGGKGRGSVTHSQQKGVFFQGISGKEVGLQL